MEKNIEDLVKAAKDVLNSYSVLINNVSKIKWSNEVIEESLKKEEKLRDAIDSIENPWLDARKWCNNKEPLIYVKGSELNAIYLTQVEFWRFMK